MPSHVKFTKPYLDKLLKVKPKEQITVWDEKQAGLCILHSPGPAHRPQSTVTLRACYYTKDKPGIPKYVKIGRYGEKIQYRDMDGALKTLDCGDIEAVRTRCSEIRNASKAGNDPKRPRVSGNVGEVVELYLKRSVAGNKTADETKRIFDRYVLSEWGHRNIKEIEIDDVTALLYRVADGKIKYETETKSGKKKKMMIGTPNVASAVLSQLSALFNWYAKKAKFRSPIVKGMAESNWLSKARKRKLSDEEIEALWMATADLGVYGSCVRTALLTAQRFFKVGHMRRNQIKDGIWDGYREGDDEKNKQISLVPLTSFTLGIINSVPIIDAGRHSTDYVFSLDGRKPYNGWSNAKEILDKKMAEILNREIEPWQHRDLRRTARSRMSQLGVPRHLAEHCLAHTIKGVEGVYDRYEYIPEKRDAFQKLSDLIESIVTEETDAETEAA